MVRKIIIEIIFIKCLGFKSKKFKAWLLKKFTKTTTLSKNRPSI